ncbi:FAD-dependent oxidoreductase [uncultured Cohaesibacter sp.]|uniref:FAD-dependent oxidoreductase n=1 Tax=uncultured Cohaesibacter sp. TaxID=1002546 RepID=UPI0029C7230C|nr:FAD-dependent oxidoreductase [uncultured Cohaesibacter sp.]
MRSETLKKLHDDTPFDVLVIGGGATGCGIALDAATRGLRTALVERFDFCEGTSSRCTKLVHGGVRYLEAAVKRLDKEQYNLVREALHERGAFLRNAPHLSNRLPLITPVYSWWQVPYIYVGLKMYDLLSGKMNIGHSKIISAKEAKRRFPMLHAKGLKACVQYYDGQFVDVRMAISIAMTAERAGAVMANHVEVISLLHDEAKNVVGAHVRDSYSGEEWDVRAKKVINATGPFADGIRKMDDEAAKPILKVSSGIHMILDADFVPPDGGLLIPQTDDGRVLFILPWQGQALVGTTDNECKVESHPEVSPEDIRYLLSYVRRYFDIDVSEKDVKSAWSGIRPLVFNPHAKDTSQLARDHVIIEDKSGLVTISGGKWTTYRLMAEQAVDRIVKSGVFGKVGSSRTHDMKVIGGEAFTPGNAAIIADKYGLDEDIARHLNEAYGDQSDHVARIAAEQDLKQRLHPDYGFIEAEIAYAIEREAATSASDFICGRTTIALIDKKAAAHAAPRVVALMAERLGWDETRTATERQTVMKRLEVAF